eukprot:4486330-Amphidinium_carterae.2
MHELHLLAPACRAPILCSWQVARGPFSWTMADTSDVHACEQPCIRQKKTGLLHAATIKSSSEKMCSHIRLHLQE